MNILKDALRILMEGQSPVIPIQRVTMWFTLWGRNYSLLCIEVMLECSRKISTKILVSLEPKFVWIEDCLTTIGGLWEFLSSWDAVSPPPQLLWKRDKYTADFLLEIPGPQSGGTLHTWRYSALNHVHYNLWLTKHLIQQAHHNSVKVIQKETQEHCSYMYKQMNTVISTSKDSFL